MPAARPCTTPVGDLVPSTSMLVSAVPPRDDTTATATTLYPVDSSPEASTMKDCTSHPSSPSPNVSALPPRSSRPQGWPLKQPSLPPFVQAAPVDPSAISTATTPCSFTHLEKSVQGDDSAWRSTICDGADVYPLAPLQQPNYTNEHILCHTF